MFKRIENQIPSNYQTAPSLSINEVKARAEGFIEQGMMAYAAGDTGSAGHAFQSARFHARSLKKGDAVLQAPRRGFTPTFAAIVHRDLRGLNAVLDSDGFALIKTGNWAIHYGYAEGLAAVGDRLNRLNAASLIDRNDHISDLARKAVNSKSPAIVSALWGAMSEDVRTKVLNPALVSTARSGPQRAEEPDPETQRALAMAAFRATWAGAAPSSEPR